MNYSKSSIKGFDQRTPEEIAIAEQIKSKNLSIKEQKELERKNSRVLVRVRAKNSNGTPNSTNGFANAVIVTVITIIIAIIVAIGTLYFLK